VYPQNCAWHDEVIKVKVMGRLKEVWLGGEIRHGHRSAGSFGRLAPCTSVNAMEKERQMQGLPTNSGKIL